MLTIRRHTQDKFTDPSYHHVENSKFILRIRSDDKDQFPSVELHIKGKAGIVYELCNSFQRSHVYYSSSSRIEDHLENNYRIPQVPVTLKDLALVSQLRALRDGTMTLTMHGVKNHGKNGDLELRIKADHELVDERGTEYTRIFSMALLLTPVYIPDALLMKLMPVQRNMIFVRISHYFLIIRTHHTTHLYPSVVLFDDQSTPKMIYRLYQVWESYAKDNTLTIPSLPVSTIDELSLITQAQNIRGGSAKIIFNSAIKDSRTDRLEMHLRMTMEGEVFGLRMHFDPIPTYVNDDCNDSA